MLAYPNKSGMAKNEKAPEIRGFSNTGGRIRTLNLLIRSQVLYPIELRPHCQAAKAAIEG